MLDLPVRVGVRYGGPVDADVIFIVELEELLPGELRALSVIIEFGTPKRWTISRKKCMACSDLITEISWASIHLVNLSMVTKQVGIAPERSFERSNQIEPPDHKWPRDGDHLECLGW